MEKSMTEMKSKFFDNPQHIITLSIVGNFVFIAVDHRRMCPYVSPVSFALSLSLLIFPMRS